MQAMRDEIKSLRDELTKVNQQVPQLQKNSHTVSSLVKDLEVIKTTQKEDTQVLTQDMQHLAEVIEENLEIEVQLPSADEAPRPRARTRKPESKTPEQRRVLKGGGRRVEPADDIDAFVEQMRSNS